MTDASSMAGTNKRIRLLIVDDQELILTGLAELISFMPDVEIAAQKLSGKAVLSLDKATLDSIDVALIDARMPQMSGTELISRLHADYPGIKCILLTAFDEDDNLIASMKAGSVGYLLKDVSTSELNAAIHTAATGGKVIGASATAHVIRLLAQSDNSDHDGNTDDNGNAENPSTSILTPRDQQIASFVAQGMTNSEIASKLFLSTGTVKNHVSRIFSALNVRNRTELTALLNGTLD
ncbi:response regulator transcription factor [Bifidobacterium sp. ESL0732]|uniref:response regulator n=1 Tax=Bifidobacterium sp. ESL0732 TaxID=2983222 RepID=UPI0023F623E0|nr:response regulator transcription factor [Bifidobacterium sp. ESL0732]WEV63464.1 response regulator transcription factor [Bifidobacterium sp. ESL0732]